MSFPKIILTGSCLLFVGIGLTAIIKKKPEAAPEMIQAEEIDVAYVEEAIQKEEPALERIEKVSKRSHKLKVQQDNTEDVDDIYRLFTLSSSKYPFVETIRYTSRAPWLKGRPAWVADYASYFKTSKHFIARSLNGKPDYFSQKVKPGDRFNVFKKDRDISFHLLCDLSRCKLWFYAIDLDDNARYLMKTYKVGLGRLEDTSPSGSLTPTGKFLLGDKIALYKSGVTGYFQDEEAEMIQVFGTRWMPFGEEIGETSHPAKGYGIHGSPWVFDEKTESLFEDRSKISHYESDGCIRLNREDIEEIFSIVITKPTVIEVVQDFQEAELPGIETKME
ncbi:MAG: L,D-transpeptidase [Simkaniaceae bacterium]